MSLASDKAFSSCPRGLPFLGPGCQADHSGCLFHRNFDFCLINREMGGIILGVCPWRLNGPRRVCEPQVSRRRIPLSHLQPIAHRLGQPSPPPFVSQRAVLWTLDALCQIRDRCTPQDAVTPPVPSTNDEPRRPAASHKPLYLTGEPPVVFSR